MNRRPRLLVPHPSLRPPGGGNAVAAWLLQALAGEYDITVYAWEPIDFERVNRFVGTSLRASDVHVRRVPRWLAWLLRMLRVRGALWQRSVLLRFARRVRDEYDLTLSANNEIDIGTRSVQYVHFPWGWWPRPDSDLRWFHRIPGMLRLYWNASAAIAPVSRERIGRNRTLVNSDWTGMKYREVYGAPATTVYPPVAVDGCGRGWSERDDAFIALGLEPHKRIDEMIAIVARIRNAGHDVRLRLVGSATGRGHLRRLRALVAAHPGWITLHLDLTREQLLDLLGRSRYGVHAMREEHFGMAPAEMARSGCIVFVHDSGGQVEIVGRDERLVWLDEADAATRILRVLDDGSLQRELQELLLARAGRFSYERFRDQVRSIVAEELSRIAPDTPPAAPLKEGHR